MLDNEPHRAGRTSAKLPGSPPPPQPNETTIENLQQRAEQLSALHATLLDISAPYELPELLEKILERALHLLNAPKGSLFLVDAPRKAVRCVAVHGFSNLATGMVLPFGQGATGKVAQSGQPLIIQEYPTWAGRLKEPAELQSIRSLLSVPMLWQGQVSGVINVAETSTGRLFSQQDTELLSMFANQSAILVENAHLLQEEHQQREAAETLREVASVLSASLNRAEVLEQILAQLARVVQYDSASVMLISGEKLEIVAVRGFDLEERKSLSIESLKHLQEVIETRSYLIIPDTPEDPRWVELPQRTTIRCWLGVPLVFQDQVIGVLNLDKDQPGYYSSREAELTAAFASQAAIAIENARMYDEVEQRVHELSCLYLAAQDLADSLEPDVVLEKIVRHITNAIQGTSGHMRQIDDEGRVYEVLATYITEAASKLERSRAGLQVISLHEYPEAVSALHRGEAVSFSPGVMQLSRRDRAAFNSLGLHACLVVPVVYRGRLLGEVEVWETRCPRSFTAAEKSLLQALAQHAAGTIENAHLFMAERQRVKELDALRATIADITSELELPNLLRDILERAVTLMDATGGDLGIYNQADRNLLIVTSFNLDRDYTGTCLEMGEGLMGQVAQSLEPLIVDDYQSWPGRSEQYASGPWKGAIVVPLQMGSKLLGAIGVVDAQPNRQFTLSDQRLLTMFAQQASIAINNARMYLATKEAADRRAILHQASQAIVAASLDSEGIYTAIHEAASKLMPSEAFVIAMMNESQNHIDAVYLMDRSGRTPTVTIPAGAGLSGHIIKTGKPLYIEDLDEYEGVESIRFGDSQDVRSILAVPMILRDKVTGMLSVQSYQARAYTPEDMYLLEMLSAHAAIAIDNTRLFQEVQQLAITDPLTGANNRRELYELGEREFARSKRYKHPLSALMVDIDRFKKVNDSFGHTTGDQVLIQLTGRIRANIRDIDILGRYGGDEFAILLPDTELEPARQVAERLRTAIANIPFETDAGAIHITTSIGVSTLAAQVGSLEVLIDKADMGVYAAKDAGRNRVRLV